jgi:uncharacterized small protein (DUF1192 family)
MVKFSQDFAGLQAEVSAMSDKISIFEQATTDNATVATTEGLLNTLQEVQARAEAIKTELGDRIATLNGELALSVSAAVQDTLSGQSEAYNKLITEMSAAMNGLGTSDNTLDLIQIQASMNDSYKELEKRIGMIQTSTAPVRAPRPQPKQEPDIIKFP